MCVCVCVYYAWHCANFKQCTVRFNLVYVGHVSMLLAFQQFIVSIIIPFLYSTCYCIFVERHFIIDFQTQDG